MTAKAGTHESAAPTSDVFVLPSVTRRKERECPAGTMTNAEVALSSSCDKAACLATAAKQGRYCGRDGGKTIH